MAEPEAAAAAQEKSREEAYPDAPVAADSAVRSSTSPPLPPSSPLALASGSAHSRAGEESASAELATLEVASAVVAEDRVKGPWSPEEDVILSRLVSRFGARNWSLIARGIPGRSGKSCRLRWCNQLDPYVKRRPFTDPAQMQTVKHALHVATPPAIVVCREEEQKNILEFCKSCLQQSRAGSLYVCGCPGTGKTLSIGKVKEYFLGWSKEVGVPPDVLTINCTSLTSTSEIFSQMLVKFEPSKRKATNTSPLQHLQDIFSQKKHQSGRMLLMIADEMDYLITRDHAVLHDLFMLTTLPFSRFILIGIANAIDLADRFLQKLESLNCKPVVITFRAYSKEQILKILQQRIMVLGYDVFQPAALEYCARKVAAASGDIRRALDICRCAIEVLEAELRGSVTNKETEMVSFHHIDIAISRSFKSPVVDIIRSLPQHQQVILCSFVRLSQHCKKNATTLAELNRSYSEICKSTQMPPVGMMDFASLCSALNDQGLLEITQSRGDKSKKIKLKVDSSDITFALKGIRFFQNCFA